MSEQAMSDERLASIRETHRQLSYLGKGHALGELLAEVDRLRAEHAEPRPGVMHPVDKAFYDLAIKERNYERVRADRLAAEVAELTARAERVANSWWDR